MYKFCGFSGLIHVSNILFPFFSSLYYFLLTFQMGKRNTRSSKPKPKQQAEPSRAALAMRKYREKLYGGMTTERFAAHMEKLAKKKRESRAKQGEAKRQAIRESDAERKREARKLLRSVVREVEDQERFEVSEVLQKRVRDGVVS